MEKLIRIGMDTSKSVFQLHGVDAAERPALVKKLHRRQVISFFKKPAKLKIVWRHVVARIIGDASSKRSDMKFS